MSMSNLVPQGEWQHSFEEDDATTTTYRPAALELPAARWRSRLEILSDGRFVETTLGPDDRPMRWIGQWTYSPPSLSVTLNDGNRYTFNLVESSTDVLRFKRIQRGDSPTDS